MLAATSLEKRLLVINKTLLDYNAAQQKSDLCDVTCEGLSTCQAIDCCQRGTTSAQIVEVVRNSTNQSTEFLM